MAIAQEKSSPCWRFRGEARYRAYGYNHVVVIHNGCAALLTCQVSTDVNPQSTTVQVEAGADAEVVTFLGSPATDFAPKVQCRPR